MVVASPPRPAGTGGPTDRSDLEALREQALIEEARRRARRRRRGYALVVLLGLAVAVALVGRPRKRTLQLRPGRATRPGRRWRGDRLGQRQDRDLRPFGNAPDRLSRRLRAAGVGPLPARRAGLPDSRACLVAGRQRRSRSCAERSRRQPLDRSGCRCRSISRTPTGGAERLLAGCGSCGEQTARTSQLVAGRLPDRVQPRLA